MNYEEITKEVTELARKNGRMDLILELLRFINQKSNTAEDLRNYIINLEIKL